MIDPEERGPRNFTLVALGGFGRKWLFPHSDLDLLFLHADRETEQAFKDRIREFSQGLWDLRLKVSPATRTLQECDRFDPANGRVRHLAAGLPLSRWRCRSLRAVARQNYSKVDDARGTVSLAAAG